MVLTLGKLVGELGFMLLPMADESLYEVPMDFRLPNLFFEKQRAFW